MEASEEIAHFKTPMHVLAQLGIKVDYFIDCMYHPPSQRLFLIGGTHDGNVEVLHVNAAEMSRAASLHGGHTSTVRTVHWDMLESESIVTGSEDSSICLWGGAAAASGGAPALSTPATVVRSPIGGGGVGGGGGVATAAAAGGGGAAAACEVLTKGALKKSGARSNPY
jgi:hypothetical protein